MSTLIINSCTKHSAGNFSIPAGSSYSQQGSVLQGTGKASNNFAYNNEGQAVAISADGNTMVSGGLGDNDNIGALWVYVRVGGVWSEQGTKLTGTNSSFNSTVGGSIAISGDGNTILTGGENDGGTGSAWVFTRTGATWSQQGSKLVPTGESGSDDFGISVSLSNDGNSAVIGEAENAGDNGAIWFFSRTGNTWTQKQKITGINTGELGQSVAISGDGQTVVAGAPGSDNDSPGISYIYGYDGTNWDLQGSLIGAGDVGSAQQGHAVAISADGNTVLIEGFNAISGRGAAWIFNRVGITWTQNGEKLLPADNSGGTLTSVSLSADGTVAILGNPYYTISTGVAWIYTLAGSTWSQYGPKFMGTSNFGSAVAISSDGSTFVAGAFSYGNGAGANFVYSASPVAPVQSSNVSITNLSATTGTASWTNGNGAFHAVFITPASGVPFLTPSPVNNMTYTANAALGGGTEIGSSGFYCVYNGPGSTVSITGLFPGTVYLVKVFDYNGTTGNENYNLLTATGNPVNFSSAQTPAVSVTGILTALSTTFGTPSATSKFEISGQGLSAGVLVTSPAGYEVSASPISGFFPVVTVGAAGELASTPIYIRLTASTGVGSAYSGNVILSTLGAPDQHIATAVSTVSPAPIIITATGIVKYYGSALTAGVSTADFAATGLLNGNQLLSVMLTPDASGLSARSPAGSSYTVQPSSVEGINGFDAANYSVAYVAFTGIVEPRVLHVTATGIDKIYNNSYAASAILTDDRISGDIFVVSYASASFADKNVGSLKLLAVNMLTLAGAAAQNYTVAASAFSTASIIAASVMVTAVAATKVYDGNTSSAFLPAITGLFVGDIAGIFPVQTYDSPSIGSGKTMIPSGLLIEDANGGANYAITYQEVESGAITAVPEPVATTVIGNNMVSPNGDGVNDYWTVSGILNFPLNIVTIYDRSGRIVFTQRGYANTWGCLSRGALLPEDTYYYKIDLGNGSKVSKGFITLIYNRN